jgi:predicted hydrocarbon binding protein
LNELEQSRVTLQETMSFLAAMASGVEQLVGPASKAMAFIAGKNLGKKFAADAKKTADLDAALGEVRRVLQANDCLWSFEPFKRAAEAAVAVTSPDGAITMKLVFRDCMIRQSLFRYGHEQKGSLCTMMYGFFSGALETITGRKSELTIDHAGENACLKTLVLHPTA